MNFPKIRKYIVVAEIISSPPCGISAVEIRINTGENIYDRAISAMSEEIEKEYKILSITEVPLCDGCYYESGGQRAHMGCPDGCLHDPEECGYE